MARSVWYDSFPSIYFFFFLHNTPELRVFFSRMVLNFQSLYFFILFYFFRICHIFLRSLKFNFIKQACTQLYFCICLELSYLLSSHLNQPLKCLHWLLSFRYIVRLPLFQVNSLLPPLAFCFSFKEQIKVLIFLDLKGHFFKHGNLTFKTIY